MCEFYAVRVHFGKVRTFEHIFTFSLTFKGLFKGCDLVLDQVRNRLRFGLKNFRMLVKTANNQRKTSAVDFLNLNVV